MKFLQPHYRVSTDDKGQDPLRQDKACRPWAERHGYTLLNPVVDEGTSAFRTLAFDRPKFIEACEKAKSAGADGLLFESPDRFSRIDPFRAIWEMVEVKDKFDLEIYFASADLSIQQTFAGKLLLFVQLAMSHEWAVGHASKVQLGMEKKKAQGVRFGRKPKELTDEEWDLFDKMRDAGSGWETIAVEINARRLIASMRLPNGKRARVETLSKTTLRRADERRELQLQKSGRTNGGENGMVRLAEETPA